MKNIIAFITITLLLTFLTFGDYNYSSSARSTAKLSGVKKMEARQLITAKKAVRKVSVSKMYNSIFGKAKLARIPVGCKAVYDIAVKAEKAQLNKCLQAIGAKWDGLTNSQLVQVCGNKTMQQCYDDFVNTEKNKCSASFLNKIAELTAKYIKCVNNGMRK